jgi:hypothetical protein
MGVDGLYPFAADRDGPARGGGLLCPRGIQQTATTEGHARGAHRSQKLPA